MEGGIVNEDFINMNKEREQTKSEKRIIELLTFNDESKVKVVGSTTRHILSSDIDIYQKVKVNNYDEFIVNLYNFVKPKWTDVYYIFSDLKIVLKNGSKYKLNNPLKEDKEEYIDLLYKLVKDATLIKYDIIYYSSANIFKEASTIIKTDFMKEIDTVEDVIKDIKENENKLKSIKRLYSLFRMRGYKFEKDDKIYKRIMKILSSSLNTLDVVISDIDYLILYIGNVNKMDYEKVLTTQDNLFSILLKISDDFKIDFNKVKKMIYSEDIYTLEKLRKYLLNILNRETIEYIEYLNINLDKTLKKYDLIK